VYNRYIPGNDGRYRIEIVPELDPARPPTDPGFVPEQNEQKSEPRIQELPAAEGFDLGDLLLLCIVLLLCVDCGEGDLQSLLITAAAFLFLS